MRRAASLALALLLLARAAPARAAGDDDAARRRAFAVPVAATGGLVVHGAGHLAKGDPRTAGRLAAIEGSGILAMGTGLGTLILTGASRKLVGPAAGLMALGFGAFATSALWDIYGSAVPDEGLGAPRLELPKVEARAGVRALNDRVLAPNAYLVTGADVRLGRARLDLEQNTALDAPAGRTIGLLGWRLHGPQGGVRGAARDSSFVDVEVGGSHHALGREGVTQGTVEARLATRVDGARIAPHLRGSFVEAHLGMAHAWHTYRSTGSVDATELLLARVAWGFVLGRPGATWSELSIDYDHRHDGLAGGLKMPGLGSGTAGSLGTKATVLFGDRFGVVGEGRVGSAWLLGLGVLYRGGLP